MKDNILDQEWDFASLVRFAFPTMAMMIFMGLYTMVDTVFVARFVSTDALSAINIVCPVINLTVGLGTMLATGGNAVISRKMGAGLEQEAQEDFTLLVLTAGGAGAVIWGAGTLWLDKIVYALGASRRLFPYCRDYLGTLKWFIPANMLQTLFSNLLVTAGRPGLGLGLSVTAGLANLVLDYVFIAVWGLGISGAALGTGVGYLIPAAAGAAFFMRTGPEKRFVSRADRGPARPAGGNASPAGLHTGLKRRLVSKGQLSFTKPKWNWSVVRESCLNGSSEMVGQMSGAVTTFLFNTAMMELAGEDGVAAVTIMIYSQFLLSSLYIGFSMGVAPVVGFNYGSGNRLRQKKVFRICLWFMAMSSLSVFLGAKLGSPYLLRLFAPAGSEVFRMASEGFSIFCASFLFCGLNIFASALFTALSNGKLSAALSFLRTFVLLAGGILVLPGIFGVTGVWLAVPVAEGIMFFLSAACLWRLGKDWG